MKRCQEMGLRRMTYQQWCVLGCALRNEPEPAELGGAVLMRSVRILERRGSITAQRAGGGWCASPRPGVRHWSWAARRAWGLCACAWVAGAMAARR